MQSTLFNNKQWCHLKDMFPCKKYDKNQYKSIRLKLKLIIEAYKKDRPFHVNWMAMYDNVKEFQQKYDTEKNEKYADIDFCLYFFEVILKIIKHHHYVFQEDIDKSEWDYLTRIWCPILERCFTNSGLRLKW
jgi:hypothetical protein